MTEARKLRTDIRKQKSVGRKVLTTNDQALNLSASAWFRASTNDQPMTNDLMGLLKNSYPVRIGRGFPTPLPAALESAAYPFGVKSAFVNSPSMTNDQLGSVIKAFRH